MSICIVAAGKLTMLAGAGFTLAWTHSVEKTRWEEDWVAAPTGLQVVEARVQGSGAGMEPSDNAFFKNGWWVYAPRVKPLPKLVLAASGVTDQGWALCTARGCVAIGGAAGDPAVVTVCGDPAQ